jgi:hypothetical protein
MAKKKSKFQELVAKTKETLVPSVPELDSIVPEADPVEVLRELELSSEPEPEAVKEDLGQYATKEQKEAADQVLKQVFHPESRKAYNIWYSNAERCYYMDTIEYDSEQVLEFKSEKLTASQALAMAKAKQIFSDKLILKKKGV